MHLPQLALNSAIICSIFRVQTTIHMTTGTQDTTYAFGPVILWAQAEMACGFFIASAPSLPRVLRDTPWLARLFGLQPTGTDMTPGIHGNTGLRTFGGSGPPGSKGLSLSTVNAEAYCQIDDEIALDGLERPGAAKQARYKNTTPGYITATTRVTVSHDVCHEPLSRAKANVVVPWASWEARA